MQTIKDSFNPYYHDFDDHIQRGLLWKDGGFWKTKRLSSYHDRAFSEQREMERIHNWKYCKAECYWYHLQRTQEYWKTDILRDKQYCILHVYSPFLPRPTVKNQLGNVICDTISSKTKPSSKAKNPIEDAYFHFIIQIAH